MRKREKETVELEGEVDGMHWGPWYIFQSEVFGIMVIREERKGRNVEISAYSTASTVEHSVGAVYSTTPDLPITFNG